jgi:hypothetical protein
MGNLRGERLMELAWQVPYRYMNQFKGHFHYALAHLVLSNADYARFFLYQDEPVVMDNGVHENGEPLPWAKLEQAAWRCNARYIIPPDWFFDGTRTYDAFKEALSRWGPRRLWPVLQGTTVVDLRDLYELYMYWKVPAVCIPYRLADLRWKLIPRLTFDVRHHFLGLRELDDLKYIKQVRFASLDTGKPFRFAQQNHTWDTWRSSGPKLQMGGLMDVDLASDNITAMTEVINAN